MRRLRTTLEPRPGSEPQGSRLGGGTAAKFERGLDVSSEHAERLECAPLTSRRGTVPGRTTAGCVQADRPCVGTTRHPLSCPRCRPNVDVVTRLREGELRPLRLQAADGLHASAFKSLYERGEGQELVRQQYTGRYPFELLQNANDAARDAGERGRAHFLLTETALIVADNGFGFGDKQVDAICSLGRSSKGPGEAVGHKGLGFKSVGEITDHPQITSARASFQFSSDRVRAEVSAILGRCQMGRSSPSTPFRSRSTRLTSARTPSRCRAARRVASRPSFVSPSMTASTAETVEKHLLHNLHPRLLLFLPHVDHLELRGTSGDFSAEVSREPENGVEHVLLATVHDRRRGAETSEEWFIYRGSVVPDTRCWHRSVRLGRASRRRGSPSRCPWTRAASRWSVRHSRCTSTSRRTSSPGSESPFTPSGCSRWTGDRSRRRRRPWRSTECWSTRSVTS